MNHKVRWSVLLAGGAILMTLALVGDGGLGGQRAEAQSIAIAAGDSFFYRLELQGQQMGDYLDCAGLGSHNEVEEQAVITTTGGVLLQKTPGALQWHKIVLKRPTPSDVRIWQWRQTMEATGLAPSLREGRITMYQGSSSQPVAQWTFSRGWPAGLVFNGSEEELVIVHEGLVMAGAGMGGGTTTTTRRE